MSATQPAIMRTSPDSYEDPQYTSCQSAKIRTSQCLALPQYAILVLGPTGTGKSTFISTTSKLSVQASHNLEICTLDCASYPFEYNGKRITLIDTPGFNGTARCDTDIIGKIAIFLNKNQNLSIIGVIYFHRATDTRLTGTSLLNLQALKAFCGREFYPHITISTTMWGTTMSDQRRAECHQRITQLKDNPSCWGDLMSAGAKYSEFDNTHGTGLETISAIIDNPLPAYKSLFEQELNSGKSIGDTKAGEILLAEKNNEERKRLEELKRNQATETERLQEEGLRLVAYRQECRAQMERMNGTLRVTIPGRGFNGDTGWGLPAGKEILKEIWHYVCSTVDSAQQRSVAFFASASSS